LGQRFHPSASGSLADGSATYQGAEVVDEALGWSEVSISSVGPFTNVEDFTSDSLPGFTSDGFSHGADWLTFGCRAASAEAQATDTSDQTYQALEGWLSEQTSTESADLVTLNVAVRDEQGDPLEAKVLTESGVLRATGRDGQLEWTRAFEPNALYEIVIGKEGFQSRTMVLETSGTPETSVTNFGTVELLPEGSDTIEAKLTVRNSSTGSALESVQVNAHRVGNEAFQFDGNTDASGQLTVPEIFPGAYDVTLQKDGFDERTVTVTFNAEAGQTSAKEVSLSQPLSEDSAELVLKWEEIRVISIRTWLSTMDRVTGSTISSMRIKHRPERKITSTLTM